MPKNPIIDMGFTLREHGLTPLRKGGASFIEVANASEKEIDEIIKQKGKPKEGSYLLASALGMFSCINLGTTNTAQRHVVATQMADYFYYVREKFLDAGLTAADFDTFLNAVKQQENLDDEWRTDRGPADWQIDREHFEARLAARIENNGQLSKAKTSGTASIDSIRQLLAAKSLDSTKLEQEIENYLTREDAADAHEQDDYTQADQDNLDDFTAGIGECNIFRARRLHRLITELNQGVIKKRTENEYQSDRVTALSNARINVFKKHEEWALNDAVLNSLSLRKKDKHQLALESLVLEDKMAKREQYRKRALPGYFLAGVLVVLGYLSVMSAGAVNIPGIGATLELAKGWLSFAYPAVAWAGPLALGFYGALLGGLVYAFGWGLEKLGKLIGGRIGDGMVTAGLSIQKVAKPAFKIFVYVSILYSMTGWLLAAVTGLAVSTALAPVALTIAGLVVALPLIAMFAKWAGQKMGWPALENFGNKMQDVFSVFPAPIQPIIRGLALVAVVICVLVIVGTLLVMTGNPAFWAGIALVGLATLGGMAYMAFKSKLSTEVTGVMQARKGIPFMGKDREITQQNTYRWGLYAAAGFGAVLLGIALFNPFTIVVGLVAAVVVYTLAAEKSDEYDEAQKQVDIHFAAPDALSPAGPGGLQLQQGQQQAQQQQQGQQQGQSSSASQGSTQAKSNKRVFTWGSSGSGASDIGQELEDFANKRPSNK